LTAYFSDSSGTAENNICRLNKSDGIQVQDNAKANLNGNRSEENED
jgi:parallel beta-helix repeat protein